MKKLYLDKSHVIYAALYRGNSTERYHYENRVRVLANTHAKKILTISEYFFLVRIFFRRICGLLCRYPKEDLQIGSSRAVGVCLKKSGRKAKISISPRLDIHVNFFTRENTARGLGLVFLPRSANLAPGMKLREFGRFS